MQFNDGGEVRGEALFTDRGCWFVCYPSSNAKCRLTNFKQEEMDHAQRALDVFRELGKLISDRTDLMKAGGKIRACLREDLGMPMIDILIAALAAIGQEDLLTDEAKAVVLGMPIPPPLADPVDMPAPPLAASDLPPPPPVADPVGMPAPAPPPDMPAPLLAASDPPPPPPLLADPVDMRAPAPPPDMPASPLAASDLPPPPPLADPVDMQAPAPPPDPGACSSSVDGGGDHAVRGKMLLYADQVQKTGKYVGIFAFVVWACARRRRVQLLFGNGLLDIITTYAPWALGATATCAIPRVAAFCKVFRCNLDGVDHVVVRHLLNNADLANGNHWVAAIPCPGLDKSACAFLHPPCGGRRCAGGPSGHCVGPLRSAAAANNLTIVTTTANGDCAFDVMAFWDGAARNLACWKRLRIEIANMVREHAAEEHWCQCFVSCGEYDAAENRVKAAALPSSLVGKVAVE